VVNPAEIVVPRAGQGASATRPKSRTDVAGQTASVKGCIASGPASLTRH